MYCLFALILGEEIEKKPITYVFPGLPEGTSHGWIFHIRQRIPHELTTTQTSDIPKEGLSQAGHGMVKVTVAHGWYSIDCIQIMLRSIDSRNNLRPVLKRDILAAPLWQNGFQRILRFAGLEDLPSFTRS